MSWILAFHIIAIVAWFAGLFYLPRLFVYHAQTSDDLGNKRFKVMEHKLYYYIMTPAAIISLVLGLWLLSFNPSYYMQAGWMHAKLALVLLLVIYHLYCGRILQQFKRDGNQHSHTFFRWFNEIPTVLLIVIVILVVVKPL